MRNLEIGSARLIIKTRTIEEMLECQKHEKNEETRREYQDMIDWMTRIPGHEEWACDWCIQLKNGVRVGGIGFKGLPDSKGNVEIGYGIDEDFQRNGYATEAVKALVKWVLLEPGVSCVQAQTEDNNEISKKVLMKNGFQEVGRGEEGPLFEKRAAAK